MVLPPLYLERLGLVYWLLGLQYGISFIAIAMMVSEIQFLATMPQNVRGRWFSTPKPIHQALYIFFRFSLHPRLAFNNCFFDNLYLRAWGPGSWCPYLVVKLLSVPHHSDDTWIVPRHEARHTKLLEHFRTSITKFVCELWRGEFCQHLLMAAI